MCIRHDTMAPILQDVRFVTFRISHHRLMGCPVPQRGRFESFRVSDHRFMGCPIPQCGGFESFRDSRGAQSQTSVVRTRSTSSLTL